MDDKLITIAEFNENLEAQMARATLESNGIKAVITGENIKGLLPVDGMLNVELQVFAADAEKAKKLLDSQQELFESSPEGSQ